MNFKLIEKANKIIETCKTAYIGLVDENGFPFVSAIAPVKTDNICEAYFATGTRSNKYRCLQKNSRAGVCYHAGGDNISLMGDVEILTDSQTKSRFWQNDFAEFYPLGENDPLYCVLKFTTRRAVLWIDGESAAFTIDEFFTVQSRCGLLCNGCSYKQSHGCGGCVETNGCPFHGECPIAICCQEKKLVHCGECEIIPCEKLYAYSYLDPEHGDKPQGARISVCRGWAAGSGKQVWKNVLLTSAGFEDIDGRQKRNITDRFLEMLGMPAGRAKVLFIPAAAIDDEAKRMAEKCYRELINSGVKSENIVKYNLDHEMKADEAMRYDAVYFTGGDTSHLLRRLKETGFDSVVKKMVYAGKTYVGVSAGSIIAAPNIGKPYEKTTSGLCLINAYLSVHCPPDARPNRELPLPHIPLTDNQALAVSWSGFEVIEE